jgi:hypothetical protein
MCGISISIGRPRRTQRSRWFIPAARTSTSTEPGRAVAGHRARRAPPPGRRARGISPRASSASAIVSSVRRGRRRGRTPRGATSASRRGPARSNTILSPRRAARYLGGMQYQRRGGPAQPDRPGGRRRVHPRRLPAVHGRAAGVRGADGQPYTVGDRDRATDDPGAPWVGLPGLRALGGTGSAIMGHLETGDLVPAPTEAEVRAALEALAAERVKELLDETIARRGRRRSHPGSGPPGATPRPRGNIVPSRSSCSSRACCS